MAIEIEIVEDRASETPSDKGFLKIHRYRLRTRGADGALSEPFAYDVVDRAALDAVVMLLWAEREGAPGDPYVCVRTALRPPLVVRRQREVPVPDARRGLELWELPAGLIEARERGEEGVMQCAARETEEETGHALATTAFERLGAAVYLSPGLCAEKIHVVCARVEGHDEPVVAHGDGVLEAGATVAWWPLSECLARCAEGVIEDAKTELALHRFRQRVERGR